MAAGFVHGVLNTDNMNITGESFDYGPYRFLPRNDPNFVAAYFDETGLYAFGRQPEAVFWNLRQLAGALTLGQRGRAAGGGAERLLRPPTATALARGDAAPPGADAARAGRGHRPRQRRLPGAGRGRRGAALGAVLLRLVRRRWPPSRARSPARAPRSTAARRSPISAAGWRPTRWTGPSVSPRPTSPGPSPRSCSTTRSRRSGPPSPSADDWAPFEAKLARIEAARQAWGYAQPGAS